MASTSLDRTNSSGRGKTSSGTVAGYASSSTSSVAGDDADISDVQLEHMSAFRRHQRDSAEDSSSPDRQVYMSAVWQNGKLSVAYYDIDTMQVNMLMDTEETTDFSILRRVLTQVEPSQVVVSAKMDDRMSKSLNSAISEILTDGVGPAQSNIIQVLPSLDFSVDICKRRLLGLRLPTIPQHFLESERSLYLSSLIPFENTCLVRATGGLIKYLEKARVGVELEDPDVGVPLLGLNVFTLDGQMIIDQVALSSLQIFRKESHPSAYKSCQGSGAREGLSLYGILNRCKSQIGSRLLRQWFLRPLTDMDKLKRRQDAVAFFVNPRNIEVTTNLQDCLKHIKAVPRILTQMIQAQASIGDWQALYKTAYNAIYIGDLCRAQSKSVEIFTKIGQSFTEDLHRIATLISKIVDFDESALQNRFVVKAGVDTDLDEKKRTYNGLPDYMTNVARQELDKLSADITECNIIYLPQLGYLLAIPQTTKMKEEENFGIPGLEFVFLSNNMAHYKSTRTRELDSKLGDTQCDITDHETTIMHRLQNTILEHSQVLVDVMQYAAELDCLMSLATCAREFCYTQPELTDNGEISITAGRHPLQELCCSPFVPNTTESGGDHSRVKILTGPNASGKSVYIKQVALIVFMAHLGSFVPAERASVCVTDRIFTRVKSLESVAVGLSTFMLDLNQMSDAVRNATENSLVVIDEFGKGTEAVDGVSLLCSAVKHWLSMGRACPHVFVSTHFHKALQQRLMSPTSILSFQTMETVHNAGELVFLYQLIEGHCSSSYACHVAAQAGLPAEIISRGAEVSKLLQEDKPVYRVDSASTETQMKRCNVIVSRFLELDLETADLHAFLRDFVLPASNGEI